jgi:tetratricopeptide (TPR) repeat protein
VESLWGQYLLRMGQAAEAYAVLSRVAGLVPVDADLAFALGRAAAGSGHGEQARAAFERATGLAPGHYDGWLGLAEARAALGDVEGAAQAIERAERLPAAADGRAAALRARLLPGR